MNKNWNASIITSIICRLLAVVAILAFVCFMVVFTGSLHCLWLLFLLLAVDLVPTYEFKREFPINKEKEK
jgi:hypothetical protein